MLRVAICDDDERVIADLKSIIEEEYPGKMQVALVQDVEDYLEQIKEQNELVPDIAIMDIQWENQEKNGIEYSVQMQRTFPKLKVIFLTGFINYASDIFSARPSHFLVKPVQRVKLKEALDKAMLEIEEERGNQIALYTSGEVIKVNPSYVFYIESEKHTLHFYGINGKQKFRMKMDDCLEILPDFFIRIHQSYAVNSAYLQSIKVNQAVLFDGSELPVSRRRYKRARERFLDYLEGR